MTDKRTVRIAVLLCDTPVSIISPRYDFKDSLIRRCPRSWKKQAIVSPVSGHEDSIADGPDLAVFREWLKGCLESFPDRNIPANVDLVVDGYDVVEAGDYPPESKLTGPEGYDVIMLTGSSTTSLAFAEQS